MLYCLVASPTLMLSLMFLMLYVVDQVQEEAELYYVVIELSLTVLALLNVMIVGKAIGAVYGLFYIDLIIALGIDLFDIVKERGWTF